MVWTIWIEFYLSFVHNVIFLIIWTPNFYLKITSSFRFNFSYDLEAGIFRKRSSDYFTLLATGALILLVRLVFLSNLFYNYKLIQNREYLIYLSHFTSIFCQWSFYLNHSLLWFCKYGHQVLMLKKSPCLVSCKLPQFTFLGYF